MSQPNATPSRLLSELQEIMSDLLPDFDTTFLDFDVDTARVARTVAVEAVKQGGTGDVERGLSAVTSMLLWWFLLGREHAARGYAPPIKRSHVTEGLVPDTLTGDWGALEEELESLVLTMNDDLEHDFDDPDNP